MPHKGKVYVIDDDAAMRDSLNFLLESADFSVVLFETAQNFLDALPGLAFGCVVSDVRMPGIDGIELLKRMKAGHSVFPILIMTGHGDVPLAVEAMKLGAVDFLEKPFEDDRLIGMIDAAIRQAEPAARNEACSMKCHADDCMPSRNIAGTCHTTKAAAAASQQNAGCPSILARRFGNSHRGGRTVISGSPSQIRGGAMVMSSRCWIMCAVSMWLSKEATGETTATHAASRPRKKLQARHTGIELC